MTTLIKRYGTGTILTMMMLAMSVSMVLGQEEVEAVESASSDGLMIAVIGFGLLVVFGLGAAINAQSSEDTV